MKEIRTPADDLVESLVRGHWVRAHYPVKNRHGDVVSLWNTEDNAKVAAAGLNEHGPEKLYSVGENIEIGELYFVADRRSSNGRRAVFHGSSLHANGDGHHQ